MSNNEKQHPNFDDLPLLTNWLSGALLGLGPAGGKSTLAKEQKERRGGNVVIDAEEWVMWSRFKREFRRPHHRGELSFKNWEKDVDMLSLVL